MMKASRILMALFGAALFAVPTAPALAQVAEGGAAAAPASSAVTGLTATVSGSTVAVSGAATFGGEAPLSVGTDGAGDGPGRAEAADAAGVDLLSADVSQPDPTKPSLLFEWKVTNLPSTGALPEFTFYRWGITVNGTTNYVLQAKFTNLVSTSYLDDPSAPPSHVGTAFQLRGNCGPVNGQVPVSNCHSLAWLEGGFDPATKTVHMSVPLGQTYAPALAPGAVVTPYNYDAQPIVAGFTAGVANATTEDGLDWDTDTVPSYTIPTGRVLLGIAPAGTDPSQVQFTSIATLASDGSFTGNLSTSGLAPGSYDVFARACFGTNCGASSVTVAL
jgi:hypothetical protein